MRVKHQRGVDAVSPYVPGKPIEEVQREYGLEDVIKLASNENPLGASPQALAAVKEALPKLNEYPDGQNFHLRHAIADHLGVMPEQVAVGNGADGIILETCLAYLDEESEVVVSESSFPIYDVYTHVMRAELIKIPLQGYGIDLAAMADAISDRTKLIFVCNPNNPTGTIVTAAEVDAFLERVPDHILVFFDEAYYDFVDSDQYPETLQYIRQGRTNVMTARTMSKAYGLAGIRLGYAAGSPETLAPLVRIREPFAVNLLAQAAGVAALDDKEFLARSVAANHEGRLYLYQEFERLGLFYLKSHTNFVLVRCGPQATKVAQKLLEKGMIIRSCTGYSLPEFLRITVGTPAQNARFVEALGSALQECRGDDPL